jgi:glycosyltransferase involved in cell wall biosynthesis
VVVPSTWQEPFGLVALEAMSAQACVVASAVGGLPELVAHERTGLLVPADDVAALADAMARLLADPALRQRLGRAARAEVVRRFSYTRLAGELVEKLGGPAPTPIGVAHPQLRGQGSS